MQTLCQSVFLILQGELKAILGWIVLISGQMIGKDEPSHVAATGHPLHPTCILHEFFNAF
jgi:hypothetical protein